MTLMIYKYIHTSKQRSIVLVPMVFWSKYI